MARTRKTDSEASEGKNDPIVTHWLNEIDAAKRREKEWRKEGDRIRDIYAGKKKDTTPMNILYSNTETMAPSLYSQLPRPVVQYRFKDGNPTAVAASKAGQRVLEFMLDTNVDGYESFDDMMKSVTNDGLLPGRGVSSVKYDNDVADVDGTEVKNWEMVCTESHSWNRYYCGYAKKWSKVPWIAYEMHLDKAEAKRLFGENSRKIKFTKGEEEDDREGRAGKEDERSMGERKTALVYQIWDRDGGKKIRYISPQYRDGYLAEIDDPLKLTGFFNCPRPLEFITKTDDMVPTAMYTLYENQANELNSLTVRISRITKAIKARGVYDQALGSDIEKIMEADDNELMPADKSASLAAEKGLDNAIWFMPLEALISTLRELMAAREACKQVIYEITGISDIVRGASKASETLGAQQLKSQWGTLRIKPKQGEVARYARDMLRMMLEVAAQNFSQDTWARMTGLPYLTDMQFQQAQGMVAAAQQAMQQMPPPMPGAPPDPRAAQAQQALQQAQAELQKPKWADVLKILQDDMQRAYRIDIETNSTVEPEAVEDQKNISDLMLAIGQFLNGVGPMVAQGMMPFETVQTMLLAITRRFRFGTEIEDQIKQMKPPPPQENGEKEKMAAQQQQMAQEKAQAQQKEIQNIAQTAQLKHDLKVAQDQAAMDKREMQIQAREAELTTEKAVFKLEQKVAQESLANKAAVEGGKLDHKKQLTGMEQKQAKTEQVVSKSVDSKMAESVKAMGGMIEQLVGAISQQAQNTQDLITAVKAPRRRKAIRGEDGNITETVDEVLQ